MKALIINLVLGLVLFVGALVGGLMATGRWNHEGTANIPLLGKFFPEPPAKPEGEDGTSEPDDTGHGEATPAVHGGESQQPTEASHGKDEQKEPQDPQADGKPRRTKDGKSLVEPEQPKGGSGHGEEAPAEGHGDAAKGEHPEKSHGKGDTAGGKGHDGSNKAGAHAAENDFTARDQMMSADRKNKYTPGGYFTFPGMPAGLTSKEINDAWQRVEGVLADLDKRKTTLDLREQDLQAMAEDGIRRQRELADERLRLETMARDLEARIAKFQQQVKLVLNDEIAALKRNGQTLAAFERSKAAELLAEQWRTEKGQDEVLKTLEFMDKDVVNEIVNAMPNTMVQDVLKKRLRVSREAVPGATPNR